MRKHISELGKIYYESHKIYKYNELNYDNLNFLLNNGFTINNIDNGSFYISNDNITWLSRKVINTYFSIDVHIFFNDKEIHCSKYLDINKKELL